MATREHVQALFEADDRVSGPLRDMGGEAEETAAKFEIADIAGEALESTLAELGRTADRTAPDLSIVAASTATVGANASIATAQVEGLDSALSDLDGSPLNKIEATGLDQAASIEADVDESSVVAAAATLDTVAHTRTAEINVATLGADVDTPTISPETRAAVADVSADVPTVSPDARDATSSVNAAVNEASFTAAESAAESLPSEETVDYSTVVDAPSFAIAEGFADDLTDEQILDYRAAVGQASFANAHQSAADLSDTESVLYQAFADASSFTAADAHSEALSDEEEVAFQAAIDEASFAAVEATTSELLTDADVAVEPEADESAFARVKAEIDGVLGRETVPVEMDVDEASIAAATAAVEAGIPHEREVEVEANVDQTSIAAANAQLAGIGGSGLGASFGGLHGSLSTIAILAGTALPVLLSLGAAVGGLGIALAGVASVIGAGIFGGLLAQGQAAADQSEDIEGAMEGISEVLGQFSEQAKAAFAPLMQPMFQDLSLSVIEGAITLLGDAAQSAANIYRAIQPVGDAVSAAFWQNEPAFFSALEDSAVTLAPVLGDLAIYLSRNLPGAIQFLTQTTSDLAPTLAQLGQATAELLPPLIQLGGTILSVVGPPLVWIMGVVADVVGWFTSLSPALQQSALIAVGATAGFYAIASAITAAGGAAAIAGGAVALLTSPLFLAALAIGAVVGVAAYLIKRFNLMDEIVTGLQKTWNLLVQAFQVGVNLVAGYIETMANSWISLANAAIRAYNLIPGHKDMEVIGKVDIPEADFSGMKTETDGKLGGLNVGQGTFGGGGGVGGGMGGAAAAGPGQASSGTGGYGQGQTVNNQTTIENHFHGDESTTRTRRIVQGVLQEARQDQRRRATGAN